MRSSALPGTMLGNGPQAPFINGSFSTRRLGISIRPAAVPCIVTAICLGAKRPAVLGMNIVLPATLQYRQEKPSGSDKAAYVNLAWRDRTGLTLMPINGR